MLAATTHTRRIRGSASLSNWIRFAASSGLKKDNPVIFPRGRTSLVTKPNATGSRVATVTIGIIVVACLAAWVPGVPWVTMRAVLGYFALLYTAKDRIESTNIGIYRGIIGTCDPSKSTLTTPSQVTVSLLASTALLLALTLYR